MEEMKTKVLFLNEGASLAWEFLCQYEYPWLSLPYIGEAIKEIGNSLSTSEYEKIGENIWIAKGAEVEKTAYIGANTVICKGAQIRHCAYIRGNALVGEGAVVGNSTELKNSILFDKVQVPHYNYVGDSILGYGVHMGAGSILSNVRGDKGNVCAPRKTDTGLRKFGAIVGDNAEIGCGAVLNPGTVVGVGARIYPLAFVRGYVPKNHIYKREGEVTLICAE